MFATRGLQEGWTDLVNAASVAAVHCHLLVVAGIAALIQIIVYESPQYFLFSCRGKRALWGPVEPTGRGNQSTSACRASTQEPSPLSPVSAQSQTLSGE